MKQYLLIMQHSPYENSLAAEATEFALALTAFNQTVSLLFMDQGILQLLANQDAKQIDLKNFTKVYEGLSLFDIKDVYIAQSSMQKYSAIDLMLKPQVVDDLKIADLIAAHDIVLTL